MGFLDFPDEWKALDLVTRQVLRLSLAGLKHFQAYITDSEFTRKSLIRHLGISADRVTTIYPGIEHDRFKPVEGAHADLSGHIPGISSDTFPLLLYVGSESPRKNFGVLLEAISRLQGQFPGVKLIKVGSAGGEQFRKTTLQQIETFDVASSVILLDSVDEADLPLFYSGADLFVTASKLEGFGFPVLEAMACGTAVVCSGAGSLPEVAGEAAIVVAPDDIAGWCSAIAEILTFGGKRNELIASGLVQAKKFTWEATAQQTAEVYQSLIQSI